MASAFAGWVTFRVLGGTGLESPVARELVATAGMAVAIAGAVPWCWRHAPVSSSDRQHLLLLMGWGVAAAAGWLVDVRLGGPFSGLVTGLALLQPRLSLRMLVLVPVFGLGAGRIGLALPASQGVLGGMILPGLAMAAGALLALRAGGMRVPELRGGVLGLTLWSGAAWVGAWALSARVPLPRLWGYGAASAELILAFGLVGVGLALVSRRALAGAGLDWLVGGLGAALVGIGIDLACVTSLWLLRDHPLLPATWLDVGQAVGMPMGAWVAARRWLGPPPPATVVRGAGL